MVEIDNTKLFRSRKKYFLEGNHIGRIPFGYRKQNGKIIINQKESNMIKKIFELRKKGFGYRSIAKDVKFYNNYDELKYVQIRNILKNPFYCGYVKYDKKYVKGTHSNIISEEDFLIVNKIDKIKNE